MDEPLPPVINLESDRSATAAAFVVLGFVVASVIGCAGLLALLEQVTP